jgi:hypothetical protein
MTCYTSDKRAGFSYRPFAYMSLEAAENIPNCLLSHASSGKAKTAVVFPQICYIQIVYNTKQ